MLKEEDGHSRFEVPVPVLKPLRSRLGVRMTFEVYPSPSYFDPIRM